MAEIPSAPVPSVTDVAPGFAEAAAAVKAQGDSWTAEPVEAPAETPVAEAVAETPAVEAAVESEPAFTQDAEGKWHRPDGQFASAEEVAKLDAIPAEEPVAEAVADDAPEAIVVPLKARDGSVQEIEVTDPKIAELLRANANDGMRREEFNRQMAEVQAERAEQQEFRTLLKTNPEAVILRELPQERQVGILVALLAQHWDDVMPQLQAFDTNPTERVKTAMQTQIAMRDQQAAFTQSVAHSRYITQAETAIRSLVPESVDDATSARFIADAANDIASALRANGNQPVPPEKFREILSPRLALYGFDKPAGSTDGTTPSVTAPVVPQAPARPVARPVAPKVTAPAAPSASVGGPTAKAAATVRRIVQASRIAASTAPAGAGAATVKAPLLPANASIEDASRVLKRSGNSWSGTAGPG